MKNIITREMDQVAYIKLNRPEVRNAFNPEMIAEVTEVFKELNKRTDLRAVALMGEGKSFCSGADLVWMKEMVNYDLEQNQKDANKLYDMFESISQCSLPVVGVVHGAVFGGAVGLIACCDYVIAEENTQFCMSEVKLGIAPAVISSFILKKATLGKVFPYMISGKTFNIDIAMSMGLVHESAPVGDGHHIVQHFISQVKEAGPEALRVTKNMLSQLPMLSQNEQKKITTQIISERRVSDEGQEGLKSFLEKRRPRWSGHL